MSSEYGTYFTDTSGTYNFEVAARRLENLCAPLVLTILDWQANSYLLNRGSAL